MEKELKNYRKLLVAELGRLYMYENGKMEKRQLIDNIELSKKQIADILLSLNLDPD